MALRELLLDLGVKVNSSDVKKADSALGTLKKAALAAAAAFASIKAVQGIGNLVDGVRGLGDEIDKTSQQLGIGVEALQEWRFAAGLAGVEGQEMSNSLGRLQKNAFEAAKGNKTLAKDFAKLGVSVTDAEGNLKDADTLLTEMADGFQGLDNDTAKVALSLNLMGRTGRKLLPLFKDGATGIAAMREEAQGLGFIMGQDLIDASVKLTDDQLRAEKAWQGVKNQIAAKLIPVFIKFSNLMVKLAKAVKGPLTTAFEVIEGILGAVVNIVETAVGVFGELIDIFGSTEVALGALGLAMALFKVATLQAAAATLIGWIAALLPFILMAALVAGVILLFDDIITFFKGGDSLVGRLIESFKKWVREMGGFGGIVKSIFKEVFKTILGVSDETAEDIVNFFGGAVESIKAVVFGIPTAIWGALTAAFGFVKDFAEGFRDAIAGAIDFLIDKFQQLINKAAEAFKETAEFLGLEADDEVIAEKEKRQQAAGDFRREARTTLERATRLGRLRKVREEFGGEIETSRVGGIKLTGAREGSAARFAELSQNIDASVTVNVDAAGQSNAGDIANKTVKGVSTGIQKTRQTGQAFQTEPAT